jgi:hypothetical protein
MVGLLSIEKDMLVQIEDKKQQTPAIFRCIDVITFENAENYLSTRYLLEKDTEHFILDVQKDSMLNISMTCYQLIEEMAFDLNFLSLVGTSPLGYHHPKIPNIDYILYEKVEKFYQDEEIIKFMVTKEELPENPKEMGYYQDGNGNWYFMTNRTKGSLLKFEDNYRLSWEYKQEKDERLLIELNAFTNMKEYIEKQPTIYIYEGQALHRRDIKILTKEEALESA